MSQVGYFIPPEVTFRGSELFFGTDVKKKNATVWLWVSLRWQCSSFLLPEAMRVVLSPSRVEVTVGESVVLSCKATHDTSLDVAFQWFFNQNPIDFQQDGSHFEYIQTVRAKVRREVKSKHNFIVLNILLFSCYLIFSLILSRLLIFYNFRFTTFSYFFALFYKIINFVVFIQIVFQPLNVILW